MTGSGKNSAVWEIVTFAFQRRGIYGCAGGWGINFWAFLTSRTTESLTLTSSRIEVLPKFTYQPNKNNPIASWHCSDDKVQWRSVNLVHFLFSTGHYHSNQRFGYLCLWYPLRLQKPQLRRWQTVAENRCALPCSARESQKVKSPTSVPRFQSTYLHENRLDNVGFFHRALITLCPLQQIVQPREKQKRKKPFHQTKH